VRILVIRRDNIGDLVCTTPLFAALRRRHPQAWIGALVNSYNAPVLAGNPDLDQIVAYTKLKHVEEGGGALAALGRRIRSLWKLRRMKLDCVVLATPDFSPRLLRLARLLAPRQVAGFSDGSAAARGLDLSVPIASVAGLHEVERVFALAKLLGFDGTVPSPRVFASAGEIEKAEKALQGKAKPRIAVHISARRPAQRWPVERFAGLIERLCADRAAAVMLLWSPGRADDARHPGDDDKAEEILRRLDRRLPVAAYRTARLEELIGALAACDSVVCSDGGASHVAAALGKPVVCFFGDSDPSRWRPWGVPHRIVKARSKRVDDVRVDEAASAFAGLMQECEGGRISEGGIPGSTP
jgi:ADP-heptose:LPS heptosyltransferase